MERRRADDGYGNGPLSASLYADDGSGDIGEACSRPGAPHNFFLKARLHGV